MRKQILLVEVLHKRHKKSLIEIINQALIFYKAI